MNEYLEIELDMKKPLNKIFDPEEAIAEMLSAQTGKEFTTQHFDEFEEDQQPFSTIYGEDGNQVLNFFYTEDFSKITMIYNFITNQDMSVSIYTNLEDIKNFARDIIHQYK